MSEQNNMSIADMVSGLLGDSANESAASEDMEVNETTQEQTISFEDAFRGFASHYQKTGEATPVVRTPTQEKQPQSSTEAPSGTDVVTNEDSSNKVNSNVNTNTGEDKPTHNGEVDYKQLYEKVKRDSDAKLSLVYDRLNNVSSQYQQLAEQQSKKTAASTSDVVSKQEMTPALKELYEIYPEVAEAVTQMIEARIKESTMNMESAIDKRVLPVQEHLHMSAQQQHLQMILKEHNDLPALVESGVLLDWVDNLDPVSKAGAKSVMYNGSAEEVIALLNMYKGVNSVSNASAQTAGNPNQNKSNAVVKKVMNALAVNTPKSAAPTTRTDNSAPKTVDYNSAFSALAEDYKKNVWNARRY